MWNETLPAYGILAYRLLPGRSRWSGGTSTSHLAYRAVRQGKGWAAYRDPGGVTSRNVVLALWAVLGVGVYRGELPDWFPTTGMRKRGGPGIDWFQGQSSLGSGRGNWKLDTSVLDRPKGYPANPPPSLDWRAGNK